MFLFEHVDGQFRRTHTFGIGEYFLQFPPYGAQLSVSCINNALLRRDISKIVKEMTNDERKINAKSNTSNVFNEQKMTNVSFAIAFTPTLTSDILTLESLNMLCAQRINQNQFLFLSMLKLTGITLLLPYKLLLELDHSPLVFSVILPRTAPEAHTKTLKQ